MSRLRALKKYSILPLTFWVFAQIAATGLLGFGPVHGAGFSQAGFSQAGLSQGGTLIVICTPDGFQEILYPDEDAGEAAPQVGFSGCEWCRAFDLSADSVLSPDFISESAAVREAQVRLYQERRIVRALNWPPYLGRAPPV